MSFREPLVLLVLLAVPALAALYAWERRRGRRAAAAFVRPALRPAVVRWEPGWRRHVPMALFALALAALIVAVARPQATATVPVERANVLLVTDESSSMKAVDVAPTRLEAARESAEGLVRRVPRGVHVGLVAFSRYPRLVRSPTGDREAVKEALDSLRASTGTATGEALDLALTTLRRARRPRPGSPRIPSAVVLLSDGKTTRGVDPRAVARRARSLRIPVHTVSLGTRDGTVRLGGRLERVPPDEASLRRVAEVSRGRSFTAANAGELDQVYRGLAERVGTREEPREISWIVVACALALMLGGAAASLRWFARPA